MKKAALVFFLVLCRAGYGQATDPAKISLPDRIWIATKMYSSVQTYFGHWQAVPDLDLDAVYKSYLQQISETDDRMAFDLASKEFLARLRNGHSHFDDAWLYNNYGHPLGFFLRSLGGKWVVTETRIADLSIGDAVQTIDGKAIGEFAAEKEKYVAASSDSARRKSLFYAPFLFPERFTLTLDSGKTVRIDRRSQKLIPLPARTLEGRMIQSDIGYFRIPSFGNPKNEERAVEFVRENARAQCLIFDVRGNGGGSSPERLIRALMDRPYRDWMQFSSLSIGLFGAYRQITNVVSMEQFDERTRGYHDAFSEYFDRPQFVTPGVLKAPEKPLYTGRIIVLADSGCGSACEDFVMPLKVSERATVVGETTGGSSGQPYFFKFGNGMSFVVGSKRMYFPDGSQFEGVGITPHVEVEPTIEDLRGGRDPALEKALEVAGGGNRRN